MFKFYRYIESSDELKKLSIYICTIWNAISLYETFNSLKLLGPIFISHYVNTMVMLSMCIIKYIAIVFLVNQTIFQWKNDVGTKFVYKNKQHKRELRYFASS